MAAAMSSSCLNLAGRRVVDSPLIHAPPTPNRTASEAGLVSLEERWEAMSEMAGAHRQDPTVLDLSNRFLPPETLKFGVPPKVARVVEDLRYDGNVVGRHDLPSFLDMVAQLFPNLKHISLKNNPCRSLAVARSGGPSQRRIGSHDDAGNVDLVLRRKLDACMAAAERETVRMQRLYILYRLPDLATIDGVPVSAEERNLARPASPTGHRVRKDEWLTKAMAGVNVAGGDQNDGSPLDVDGSSSDDRDDTESLTGSAVEVSFCGLINYVCTPKRVDAGTPGRDVRRNSEARRISVQNQERTARTTREASGSPPDESRGKANLGPSPANPEPTTSAPFLGGGRDDQSTLAETEQKVRSTDETHTAATKDDPPEKDVAATPPQQLPKKSTVNFSEGSGRTEAQTVKNDEINALAGRPKKKKIPWGSRPPPSPASKLRTFPMLKERRRKRTASRKLWQQRKAAVTSVLDKEEDCTDEDDLNDSDQDALVGDEGDTKEILSAFLVDVKDVDAGGI